MQSPEPTDDERRVIAQLEVGYESYLADIKAAIAQPSVSRNGQGMVEMAVWVENYIRSLGAEARQVPGVDWPLVEGHLHAGDGKPTLLFYDLYDVMPASSQPGWETPPFEPTVVDAPDGRTRLVGRGAFNSKGPLVGMLATIRAFQDACIELPVNIRFMIEGEEEVGSRTLPHYLRENRKMLSRCAGALMPFLGSNIHGQHILRLGFKGVTMLEFRATAGAWGGPTRGEIHGYWKAVVANPALELVGALNTLVSRDGRIAVEGFDTLVPPPTVDDHMFMDDVAERLNIEAWLEELGVDRLQHNEPVRQLVERLLFDCTFNLDGIESGPLAEGEVPPTQIPRSARAFGHLRVVPGVDVQKALDLFRRHLDRYGYGHIEMVTHYSYKASKCSHRDPIALAMIEAYQRHGGDKVLIYPMHAGAAPLFLFSEILGIPWISGGLGHGGGAHAPNEYFNVEDGLLFMKSMASFLFAFARNERENKSTPFDETV